MRGLTLVMAPVLLIGCLAYVIIYAWPEHKAKTVAAQLLIDPDSAKFRNVSRGSLGKICGEINGKNRLGAYVGFERFAYDTESSEVRLESDMSPELAKIYPWHVYCPPN